MNIGIDTDGVLTDEASFNVAYGREKLGREPTYPDKSRLYEMFDFDRRKKWFFCLRYLRAYCRDCPPRDGSRETVDRLRDAGHGLYEITARVFTTTHTPLGHYCRRLLYGWYKRHGFRFDEVVLCDDHRAVADKLAACRRLAVDVMIEDNPQIAATLAADGIRILLVDTPFNQGLSGENITRVKDWAEIAGILL